MTIDSGMTTKRSEKPAPESSGPAEADTYHDHKSALDWALRLETTSWIPLILAILAFLVLLAELYTYIPQISGASALDVIVSLGLPFMIPLGPAVLGLSLFVLMRAASQALLLLLDIQEKPSGT